MMAQNISKKPERFGDTLTEVLEQALRHVDIAED